MSVPTSSPARPTTRTRGFARGQPLLASLLLLLAAAGCGQQGAIGEANTVVVAVPSDSLWQQVRDSTNAVLEPTIFTVRDEQKYYVEGVDTASTVNFQRLRTFRQVVVLGTPENRFVQEVLDEADVDADEVTPPAVVETTDVWATGQHVIVAVLEPDRRAASWRSLLPEVRDRVDRWYQSFVRGRMYVSGVDSAATDSLREKFGFHLGFPTVYDVLVRDAEDGPVIVRNDNPDPSDLIRSVLVAWRSSPLDSLTADAAYEWRAAVDSVHYNVPQAIERSEAGARRFRLDGRPALEVTGVWRDEETEYPAAGPFVTWLVACPDRTYLLDAWVYAPGKDKYQYLLQVRNILQSFGC